MALSDIIGSVGGRAFVSVSLPATATRLAYEALPWTEIGLISDLGSLGRTFNETTFTPAKEAKVVPKPTSSDNGEVQIVYAYTASADAGHAILAARYGKRVSVCFALPNGKSKYFQAFVKSEVVNVGTVDNIVTETCALRITEDDIVGADTPWWFADTSPYWLFNGRAGFFTDLNPIYGKVFTTAEGNTRAINPGDPVGRIESIAGGLTLTQPSSPLRPLLARAPKSVGIVNRATQDAFFAAGGLIVSSGALLPNGKSSKRLKAPTGAATELYSCGSLAIDLGGHTWGAQVVLKSNGDTVNGSCRISVTGTSTARYVSYNPVTRSITGQNGVTSVQVTPHPIDATWDLITFLCSSTELDGQIRVRPETAIAVDVGLMQLSKGGLKPYQEAVTAVDVTQVGVPDEWYISGNGAQGMSFGVSTFGGTGLFAEAGQEFTVWSKFLTFGSEGTIVAKSTGLAANREYQMAISSGLVRIGLRAVSTFGSAPMNDGAPHMTSTRWKSPYAVMSADGILTPLSVGTATLTSQKITFLFRTEGTPAEYFTGNAQLFMIDRALADSELQRITQ